MVSVDRPAIIRRFGGSKELADGLGIPESTIRNWPALGIPGKWHLPLLRLARERGVPLTDEDLLSTTKTGRAA